jgi:hypothetical protein
MDDPRDRQVCRFVEPVAGRLQASMVLWTFECRQRFQHVSRASATRTPTEIDSFIVIASSNELTRKIMNSPAYAEPCLVASAKQVLIKENWLVTVAKRRVCADSLQGSSCTARFTQITARLSTFFSPSALSRQSTSCIADSH